MSVEPDRYGAGQESEGAVRVGITYDIETEMQSKESIRAERGIALLSRSQEMEFWTRKSKFQRYPVGRTERC